MVEAQTLKEHGESVVERKSTRLRRLVRERYSQGKAILAPTAHDCAIAKIFEMSGVEHINVAGAAPTAVWTGEPECGVVTWTEMASVADRILGCVETPGKVSIAQGGNALTLVRAFREYERAGAAMIQIEDQASGHLGGYIPGKQLISITEMTGKIRAARFARQDQDVIIAVRCDAKLAVGGGIDEMVRRCKAYVDAGAEMLMPHGLETMAEWAQIGSEMRKLGVPLIASLSAGLIFTPDGQPKRDVPTVKQLEDMGWTVLNFANHLLHAHMTITVNYIKAMMTPPHDVSAWISGVMDNGERMDILGLSTWRAIEEAFMPSEHIQSRYVSVRERDNYVYRGIDAARARVSNTMASKGLTNAAVELMSGKHPGEDGGL